MLISERIYHLLQEKHISQIEFCRRTGISQSTVSDWRRKGTNPSADKIPIICEVLDVSPYHLLWGTDSKNNVHKHDCNSMFVSSGSKEYLLLQEFRKLEEDKQNRLFSYLTQLK